MASNWKRVSLDEKILFSEGGGETLEQVAQKHYPIPGNVQGRLGWGSEQPDQMKGVFDYGMEIGTR